MRTLFNLLRWFFVSCSQFFPTLKSISILFSNCSIFCFVRSTYSSPSFFLLFCSLFILSTAFYPSFCVVSTTQFYFYMNFYRKPNLLLTETNLPLKGELHAKLQSHSDFAFAYVWLCGNAKIGKQMYERHYIIMKGTFE